MMLTSPRRRSPKLGKIEALEARDLLAVGIHGPTPLPSTRLPANPPDVQALANPSAGPKVAFVQFEPLTGRVLVVFSGDLAGYNPSTLTDPANYSLRLVKSFVRLPTEPQSRPRAGVVLAPTFAVTGVALPTPVAPGMPQTVVVTINNNQPLRNGIYQFTIRSPGIADLAGRPLDGDYFGVFPSGDGQPGGDFVANLELTHNTVIPALPTTPQASPLNPPGIAPTYVFLPSVSQVGVRYAAAKPGKFMLAGGNNITLIPLGNQDFPGTFRLPTPKPPLNHAASRGRRPA
jgi:hypothetical protein